MPGEPLIICAPRMEAEFVVLMHILFAVSLAVYLLVCWRSKRLRPATPCLVLQVIFLIAAYLNFYELLMTDDIIGLSNMFHFAWMGIFGILSMVMCVAAMKSVAPPADDDKRSLT